MATQTELRRIKRISVRPKLQRAIQQQTQVPAATEPSLEYVKKQLEYEKSLKAYNEKLSDIRAAEKLFRRAQRGKNPYIFMQPPRVRKYFKMLQEQKDAIIAQEKLDAEKAIKQPAPIQKPQPPSNVVYDELGQGTSRILTDKEMARKELMGRLNIPKGYSEKTFRETGKTEVILEAERASLKPDYVQEVKREYAGPIPKGYSEKTFRETGKTEVITDPKKERLYGYTRTIEGKSYPEGYIPSKTPKKENIFLATGSSLISAVDKSIGKIKEFKETNPTLQKIRESIPKDTSWFQNITSTPDVERKSVFPKSLTQSYFELFGVEFYEEGEREKLVQEGLKKLKEAETFEEQQKAINSLKDKGLKVELVNGEYAIKGAGEVFAPTSRVGNLLVGLTDVFFKGSLFGSYMSTGAAARQVQTQKLTEKQKLEIYKKWLNEARINDPNAVSKLREGYRKALESGDKTKIKSIERIIKDFFADTKQGREAAKNLIRDVKQQEGFIPEKSIIRPTKETVRTGDLIVDTPKQIKGIPETITLTQTKKIQRQENILGLKEKPKLKEEVKTKQDTSQLLKFWFFF
jgi:hypothetical protein